MADPHYRYGNPADRANIRRTSFAGYLPSETPSLASPHVSSLTDLRGTGSDYVHNDENLNDHLVFGLCEINVSLMNFDLDYLQINLLRTGAFSVDDSVGTRFHSDSAIVTAGDNTKGYPSFEYPDLISNERDISLGINPCDPDITNGRPVSKTMYDVLPNSAGESNILFVGGLPSDCTRREVGHLFRPFIGYKDIKVVHKEPRRSGDKAVVLCFVEFIDSRCALNAMEALQGYKFDDKKPESHTLKIQFAHFPFRPPPGHGE